MVSKPGDYNSVFFNRKSAARENAEIHLEIWLETIVFYAINFGLHCSASARYTDSIFLHPARSAIVRANFKMR
jgi:hypothetical protein